MYNVKDTDEMTPEERMRELAQILAMGYLRLKQRSPYPVGEASDTDVQFYVSGKNAKSSSQENLSS